MVIVRPRAVTFPTSTIHRGLRSQRRGPGDDHARGCLVLLMSAQRLREEAYVARVVWCPSETNALMRCIHATA